MKVSIIKKTLFILSIIMSWHLLSGFFNTIILPSPFEVFGKIIEILISGDFINTIFTTIYRTMIGVMISIIVGICIGLLMGISKTMEELFNPIVVFLQATPVISWLILALIWVDNNIIPIIVVSVSTISIPINNTLQGIKSTDSKLLEMAELFKVSRKKIYFEIYFYSILNYLLSSIKIVLGLAFKIAVMGEVISKARGGIGEKLNWAWINIETSEVIAWTFFIVIISYVFDRIFSEFIISIRNE